jgi:hypothetical protein
VLCIAITVPMKPAVAKGVEGELRQNLDDRGLGDRMRVEQEPEFVRALHGLKSRLEPVFAA